MQNALYLIPSLLSTTCSFRSVIPSYNLEVIRGIKFFIAEHKKNAVRFIHSLDANIDINSLTFYELNKHTPPNALSSYLSPIKEGYSIGLISDAGLPCLADPGAVIVREAHKKKVSVIPLIGPSSIYLTLIASGLNGQNFTFNGYLPIKEAERARAIKRSEAIAIKEHISQIFIETPYRNEALFSTFIRELKETTLLCIGQDVTGESENIRTLSIKEWRKTGYLFSKKLPCVFIIGI